MVFGGFEQAKDVLKLLSPQSPVILASFDYPYHGPRKLSALDAIQEARAFRRGIEDTLEGIGALTKWLLARPDVDPQSFGIIGASFGAPFAVSAAAQNPEIQFLILIHGFADIRAVIEHRLTQIWESKLNRIMTNARLAGWLAPLAARAASYLAVWIINPPHPESDARKLHPHQKVLVIEATKDTFIPSASRDLLWHSIMQSQAKSEKISLTTEHLQPGSDELIAELTQIVERWMGKNN